MQVLSQYADFSGRSRRSVYWYFVLFNLLFTIVATVIDNVIGTTVDGFGYGLFYIVYVLAFFIPSLAVGVRRLLDVGKCGWFLLIGLIPIVGAIWLLVLFVTDGDAGENKWGANPKELKM